MSLNRTHWTFKIINLQSKDCYIHRHLKWLASDCLVHLWLIVTKRQSVVNVHHNVWSKWKKNCTHQLGVNCILELRGKCPFLLYWAAFLNREEVEKGRNLKNTIYFYIISYSIPILYFLLLPLNKQEWILSYPCLRKFTNTSPWFQSFLHFPTISVLLISSFTSSM